MFETPVVDECQLSEAEGKLNPATRHGKFLGAFRDYVTTRSVEPLRHGAPCAEVGIHCVSPPDK